MRSALLCRGAALVAASALSITTLGVLSSPAAAHPAGDRAVNAGATWLKAQLKDGLLIGSFGPSYGPSIDAGLALKEAGDAAGVAAVDTALRAGINDYITGEAFGDTGSTYAGATAKAATYAVVAGGNPASYGGVDLVSRLNGRVSSAPAILGRIEDQSNFGDFANVIGQSFAVRALTTAGSPRAADATGFLLEQQCRQGFFRSDFTQDKTSAQQGCVPGATDSAPSIDATALSVINLLDTPGISSDGRLAATQAATWLLFQQGADGSFSDSSLGKNTNTTGLAAQALARAGEIDAAIKAAGWLRGVQIADLAPCVTTLSADNGALAPSPTALGTARTAGAIPAGQRFAYAFATAQALPALAHVPAGTGPLSLTGPATAVEKSTVTVTVTGLGAGEAGCVSFGSVSKPITGTGSNVPVTFDLPAGDATHTFTLRTLAGAQTATTRATPTPVPAPPVLATPEVGKLTVKKVVTVRNNRFKVLLTCDDTEPCAGKIVVRSAGKVTVDDAARARKVLVAKTSYLVAPGATKKIVLKVRKPARSVLAEGRVRVKAVQSAPDAERSVTKFWLRAK